MLRLHLVLNKALYEPGDAVLATVQVAAGAKFSGHSLLGRAREGAAALFLPQIEPD